MENNDKPPFPRFVPNYVLFWASAKTENSLFYNKQE